MTHLRWDLQLLRKFSSTSHFRLLNQLRSDLKANPIQRSHPTRRTQNKVETPLQKAESQSAITNPEAQKSESKSVVIVGSGDESPRTFRERLNSVDLR